MVIQRHNGIGCGCVFLGSDEEKLWRNENRFDHQSDGLLIVKFVVATQFEDVDQDINLGFRSRAAVRFVPSARLLGNAAASP